MRQKIQLFQVLKENKEGKIIAATVTLTIINRYYKRFSSLQGIQDCLFSVRTMLIMIIQTMELDEEEHWSHKPRDQASATIPLHFSNESLPTYFRSLTLFIFYKSKLHHYSDLERKIDCFNYGKASIQTGNYSWGLQKPTNSRNIKYLQDTFCGNYIASKEDYSKHKHIDDMGEIKIPALKKTNVQKANNQSSLSFFLLFYLFIFSFWDKAITKGNVEQKVILTAT